MKRALSFALVAAAFVVAPLAMQLPSQPLARATQLPAPGQASQAGPVGEPAQHPPAESAVADKAAAEHGGTEHEGAEHEAAGEEEHHEFGPPPTFNFADFDRYAKEKDAAAKGHGTPVIPYVYVLVNTLILYAMYYYLGKKPIGDGLAARRDAIAKELDEAAKIKAEAQAKLDEYTERLDKLDQELDRMKQELTLAGEKDRDRIVKEAEERAERMKKDAQFLLDQEMKQLRVDLQKYAVDAAMRAAETALASKVSPQDQERVADEFLSMLGKPPTTSQRPTGGAS